MGENKGHGVKGPRHDNDIDDLGSNQAGRQQSGNMQSGQQAGKQQDSQQAGQQQANQQSGKQQQASQQASQQSGKKPQGSQQSGQQKGSQQSGGQHASGGTPALDDLGSRQGESAQDAAHAWDQDSSADKQRGNR